MVTDTRYLSVEQCAAYIGRTPEAVRMMVKRGQLPRLKVGRLTQFDKEKIDRWMERRSHRGTGI
jgi:excisionase family DNA binding protein